jgi:hypothetical protein
VLKSSKYAATPSVNSNCLRMEKLYPAGKRFGRCVRQGLSQHTESGGEAWAPFWKLAGNQQKQEMARGVDESAKTRHEITCSWVLMFASDNKRRTVS